MRPLVWSAVRRPRRTGVVLVLALPLAASATLVSVTPAGATSTGAVVSEVYGGGGNSGATLKNDFIELANRGGSALDVSSWSVQYISAAPGPTTNWQLTPLSGAIGAGGRYLVGEAAGTGGTQDLPPTQASGSIAMSGTSGTVALVRGAAPLTCKTAADCAADPQVVDLVGYGTAAVREGTTAAPALTNTTSAQRTAAVDTDVNGTDFTAGAPTPGAPNAGGPGGPGGGTEPGPLRIHDIQGAAWRSPHDGEPVSGVPGVVTGVRTAGSSKGYWIQDPTPDASAATSEGIFVFTSAPAVAVGDSVLVAGTVKDYYPGGPPETNSNLSVTEINQGGVTVLAAGQSVPPAEVVGPRTVPTTYAPYVGGNIETTTLTPTRSALDFWESREGMRVEVDDVRVIGPTSRFGELFVTTKPNENRTPRGGAVITGYVTTPAGRIKVAPVTGTASALNVGDTLVGATIGPVDYDQFGGYKLAATTVGAPRDNGLQPTVAAPQSADQLSIATYNVENLAPSDPATKFARLASGIVTNLARPDVLTVEEVQDNTGATDDGTVAADQTLTRLTDAIVAAGGARYRWKSVDPVNDQDGGQPGGNIRIVFLYNPMRVSFVETGIADATTATSVVRYAGRPHLTLSPGRIDPTNAAWNDSRKPLVGEFLFRGRTVFVIGNHFVSKGGDQSADGRFQPPARSSEVQRQAQAALVHAFVQSILRIDRRARVVVAGDLNDYQFSPTLSVLRTGSASGKGRAILIDLIDTLPVRERYTYVFNGVSQVLDHILVTPGTGRVSYEVIHANAEFSDQASDHDPQVVRLRIR